MPTPSESDSSPRLYTELAEWWPLLSPPGTYAAEATAFLACLRTACRRPLRTLLELGSGGGNTASHLKAHLKLTLVDLAPAMLAVSRRLNPECEHVAGDMRSVRLGRTFDAVLIHDAVMYMTSPEDLRLALATAFAHCAPGGAVLLAPDFVRETFRPGTDCGGVDGEGRALRYLEWYWDPDPDDCTFCAEITYMLREGDAFRVERDRHLLGLFPRTVWLAELAAAGFEAAPAILTLEHPPGTPLPAFVGVRPTA